MKSGYYVRARRDGKSQSLDICELTRVELETFLASRARENILNWLWHMVKFINELQPINLEIHETHSEQFVVMGLGYISAKIPELGLVEAPRILEAWDALKAEMKKQGTVEG